jgi:hypothetical protein
MKRIQVAVVLGVAMGMLNAAAQENGGQLQGLPLNGGGKPPKPPIEAVLDANGDGAIDADEIANASVALETLDKNKDGKLSADEYRPSMPSRPDRQGKGSGRENEGSGRQRPTVDR